MHSTFAYEDISEPLKMYQGKACVEKFAEYIEKEVKQLYETFPAYRCVEERTRGGRKVSHLPQTV